MPSRCLNTSGSTVIELKPWARSFTSRGNSNTEDAASWSVPHFQAKSISYAQKENNAEQTREGAFFENKPPANLPRGAAYESAEVENSVYADRKLADEAVRRLLQAKETTASADSLRTSIGANPQFVEVPNLLTMFRHGERRLLRRYWPPSASSQTSRV